MKILVTGSTGLLGQALGRKLPSAHKIIGLSRHAVGSQREARHIICDLLDREGIARAVRSVSPEIVVHMQALSDVDRCEREPELAKAQNVQAITNLASAIQKTPIWLLHMSTDYVFDGLKGSAYDETDAPHPISVYGKTKLEAERLALQRERAIVVRTSTLFGQGRGNFCNRIVERLSASEPVEAFCDQTTSPTYTDDLAEAIAALIDTLQRALPPTKVLHISNSGWCTRVEFAQRIADLLKLPKASIHIIHMAQKRLAASRPAFSGLTTRHLEQIIGRRLRAWDEALSAYLRQGRLPN